MQNGIIDRLYNSFQELEHAIEGAKKTLETRENVPAEIMERLNSYDGILEKQRNLANDLVGHMEKENWKEVTRHVSLINGLSAMIRDDAKAILQSLSGQQEEHGEIEYC